MSARITKRLHALQLGSPEEYLSFLKVPGHEDEYVHLIDVVSTNVTSFFRESDHFDFLREAITSWIKAGQTRFTLWSAAASTGEEPYSIAMTLAEAIRGTRATARLLATDISTRVLDACRSGIYAEPKLEGVPAAYRQKYFNDAGDLDGVNLFRIVPELRRMVSFHRLNLSRPPFPMKGPMDVIFIRNVMIYFDNGVRQRLLAEASRLLKPGGYLMVGHSEGLTGLVSNLRTVKPSIYVK